MLFNKSIDRLINGQMECVANWPIICLTNCLTDWLIDCLTDRPTDCLINPSRCNTKISVYPYFSLLSKGRHWSSHNKEFVAWVCKLLIDWPVSYRLSELLVDFLIDQFIYWPINCLPDWLKSDRHFLFVCLTDLVSRHGY